MLRNTVKNINKMAIIGTAVAGAALTGCSVGTTKPAGSGTWSPEEVLGQHNGGIQISTDSFGNAIRNFSTFIVGIAITFFVLRVVLTAVDRMVFANLGANVRIPLAYPNPGDERWDLDDTMNGVNKTVPWTWKRIWLNFAKNIGIAAAAWVIVSIVVAIVSYVLNSVQTS